MHQVYRARRKKAEQELKDWIKATSPDIPPKDFVAMARHQIKQKRYTLSNEVLAKLTRTWITMQQMARTDGVIFLSQRIDYFLRLQKGTYPLLEVKPSLIKGAGLGVFVTTWFPYCPMGAPFPFAGPVVGPPFPDCDSIYISKDKRKLLKQDHPPAERGWDAANYINRPLSKDLTGREYSRRLDNPLVVKQNMRRSNCSISGMLVKTKNPIPAGHELLVPYGAQYRIVSTDLHSSDDSLVEESDGANEGEVEEKSQEV